MRVVNNTGNPVFLDDGTQVGAAYTETATREVESLSEADRKRYVDRPDPILTLLDDVKTAEPAVIKETVTTPSSRGEALDEVQPSRKSR